MPAAKKEIAAERAAVRDGIADGTLHDLRHTPELGPKCDHNSGRWLVEAGGAIYCFDPPTQLQKDFWIGERGGADRKRRMAMLRWLCFDCGTVQKP